MDEVGRLTHRPAGKLGRALAWAYERAPAPVDAVFWAGRRYVAPAVRHRLPLRRVTGRTSPGGPRATLVTVGAAMSLDYLLDRLFTEPPRVESLGAVSLVALPDALERLVPAVDLVLACVPRACAAWFGPDYLRVPTLVGFRIPAAGDLATTLAATSQMVRRHARRASEVGYSWTTSRAPADFDRFYAEFHRPFVEELFGARAVFRDPATLRRQFRHGGRILWIRRGAQTVAGVLLRVRGRTLHVLVEGVHPAWRQEVTPSPQFVVYLAACTMAADEALPEVDLGGAVPSLRDGVCRAKRAWGAAVRPWEDNHRDLLLRWREPGAVLRHLLHAAPLFFEAPGGALCAAAATPPGREADPLGEGTQIWRQLAPRGLQRLFLLGAGGTPGGGGAAAADQAGPSGLVKPCPGASPADINRLAATAGATSG